MKKTFEQEFIEKECVTCGCFYWVPAEKLRICQENKESFYCYNGHAQCFSKTKSQLIKEEYEAKLAEKEKQIQSNLECSARLRNELNELKDKPKRRANRIKV